MCRHRAAAVVFAAIVFCVAAKRSEADSPGTLTFADAARNEAQNGANRSIAVLRTGGSSGTAGAVCTAVSGTAVAGTDFKMTTTSLSWADGDAAAKYCIVTMLDRTPFSGTKSFVIELTSVTGANVGLTGSQTVTVHGNLGAGSVSLSSANYSVAQQAGAARVTVARAGGTHGASLVFYSTANGTALAGTNYAHQAGTLSWADGDATPKTITIPIKDAPAFFGTKTFAIALASAQNVVLGVQESAIITIAGSAASAARTTAETRPGGETRTSAASAPSGTNTPSSTTAQISTRAETRTTAATSTTAALNATTAATSTTALLSWKPPTKDTNGGDVTTLSGYRIYYGTKEQDLNKAVAVSGADSTSYEIAGLTEGTWYFAVAANAKDGTEGPRSAIASKTIEGSKPIPGFTLGHDPASITLVHGGETGGIVEVSVAPTGGFAATVNFSLSGLPANVDYAWLPAASPAGSTLVLYATASSKPGVYTVEVVGNSGSTTSKTPLAMILE